jgi:hypothetical protein
MQSSGNMKQIVDSAGNPIKGLFKKPDGSVVVRNDAELKKNLIQHSTFDRLNNQITELTARVTEIETFLRKMRTNNDS